MRNICYDEWLNFDTDDDINYLKPQKIVRPTSKPRKQKDHQYSKNRKQGHRKEIAFKEKNK